MPPFPDLLGWSLLFGVLLVGYPRLLVARVGVALLLVLLEAQ